MAKFGVSTRENPQKKSVGFAEICEAYRLENAKRAFQRAIVAARLGRILKSRRGNSAVVAVAKLAIARAAILAPDRVAIEFDGWDTVARFRGMLALGLPGVARMPAEGRAWKQSA